MRRLATPVLVLLSASTLFLGACSKDSSDTTAAAETTVAAETSAAATDAAVETTAAEATEAAATDAAATEAAAASDAAGGDVVSLFLGAIGAEPTPETLACFGEQLPDAAGTISTAMQSSGPGPELVTAMLACTPDALYTTTAKALISENPEVTDEQGKCVAASYYKVISSKSPEEFTKLAALPDNTGLPEDVKAEIATDAGSCGLAADVLTKVIASR